MLYSQMVERNDSGDIEAQQPIPVFLHGFLGSSLDWNICHMQFASIYLVMA